MPRIGSRLFGFVLVIASLLIMSSHGSAQGIVAADSSWSSKWVEAGVDGTVNALLLRNDSLFVGGDFSLTINDQLVSNLAVLRLNDTSWHDIGYRGGGFHEVFALAQSIDTDIIYVGGSFDDFDGDTTIQNLIQWDGNEWTPLSGGTDSVDGTVRAIYVQPGSFTGPGEPDEIIIGGEFTRVKGITAGGIARYRSSFGWDDFGVSLARFSSDADVYAMSFHAGELWIGGRFDLLNGDTVANVATYDFFPETWSAPNGGPSSGTVRSIDAYSRSSAYTKVVIGGSFSQINDSINVSNIALYRSDTEVWSKIDSGLAGTVYAVRGEDSISGADMMVAGGTC